MFGHRCGDLQAASIHIVHIIHEKRSNGPTVVSCVSNGCGQESLTFQWLEAFTKIRKSNVHVTRSRVHPSTPKHFKHCFVYKWGCIWNMPCSSHADTWNQTYYIQINWYTDRHTYIYMHTVYVCIYTYAHTTTVYIIYIYNHIIYIYYLTYIYIIEFKRFDQDSSPLIPVSSGRSQSSSCCHGRQNFQRQKTPRLQVGPKYPKIPKKSWLAVIFPDKLQCWWYCILLFMQLF